MHRKYQDVIIWLEKKAITEPEQTEQIINHNIELVANAFNKSTGYIHNLVRSDDFSNLKTEDEKIVNFYFGLFRKRMR